MKKMFLVLFMVFALAGTAFALGDDITGSNIGSPAGVAIGGNANNSNIYGAGSNIGTGAGGSITNTATATGGAGGNATATVGDIKNTNVNANVNKVGIKNTNANFNSNVGINSQEQGQKQGQLQGQFQGQGQGQGQMNNWSQTFEAPKAGVGVGTVMPGQGVPELNFGNGRFYDVTKTLPKFAIFGILPLGGNDTIMEVLSVNANVKFKNLYKELLSDAKKAANGKTIRFQVFCAEAQKTWTTGGNLGAGGAGAIGQGAGAAGASIVPQFGGTKADPLFTIIFVRVN